MSNEPTREEKPAGESSHQGDESNVHDTTSGDLDTTSGVHDTDTSGKDTDATEQHDDSIHVLLVDDNEQWGTFVASELERKAPTLQVTVSLSATEALLTLQDGTAIDCVVTDFRMPEISGLELLERVRREWDDLPFILITGEGSEDVASRAIERGVSDYFVKDPRTDQASLLATKIRSAVTQHRLRLAVEESEEQYRTVTEQSRDAIVIIQNFRVVFCNRRMEELVGADRGEITNADFDWDAIHPDDRDRCRSIFAKWHEGIVDDEYYEVRLFTPEGRIRYCEFIARELTYDNEHAILVTIRDVTSRIEREQALERERKLNGAVQESLITSHTRDALERSIVRELCRDEYALGWVGERVEGTVQPRAIAGDSAYLDALSLTFETDGTDSEPTLLAARTETPQFVQDFEDLFRTTWCESALEHDLRSGAGVPLIHNDITYGVLGVYSDTVHRFDESERRLLSELADTLAFAIHNRERDTALASDHTVEALLRVDGGGYYLSKLFGALDGFGDEAGLSVRGTISYDEDRYMQFLTVEGIPIETFLDAATENQTVTHVSVIAEKPQPRFQLVVSEPPPEARLAAAGAIVRSSDVTANRAIVRIELSAKRDLRKIVEPLEEVYGSVSVQSIVRRRESNSEGAMPRYVDTSSLTEKQETALRAAYYQGYFEQPRVRSATEVADSLDVSHSTFLQHLRVAQQKVLGSLFE